MSSILADGSYDLYSTPNLLGGMDMYGAENQENDLSGTEESDSIKGGNLNDIINGGNGFNYLNGQNGDDVINGGDDIDFILGGDGNDIINGGKGNDMIMGQAGDDIINGGEGNDMIMGGSGNDTFVLEFFDSVDTISDFNVDEDKVRIKGVGANADVKYDEATGKLSVDGQDIADLGVGLEFDDDNYEIF